MDEWVSHDILRKSEPQENFQVTRNFSLNSIQNQTRSRYTSTRILRKKKLIGNFNITMEKIVYNYISDTHFLIKIFFFSIK